MRKYFLELFAIGLVDSEGRINTEHMTSDALMTSMKTMEELTKMKMDRLVLETTMEMMMVCVGIYAVLVNAMTISSDLHAAMFSVAAYTVILAFSLFKTGSLSKSIFNAH